MDLISGGRLVLGLGPGLAGGGVRAPGRSAGGAGPADDRQHRHDAAAPGAASSCPAGTVRPARRAGPAAARAAGRAAAVDRRDERARHPAGGPRGRRVHGDRGQPRRPGRAGRPRWAGRSRRPGERATFTVSVHLPVFAWDGPDAWELIRDYHRYIAWKYEDMEGARGRGGEPGLPPPVTGAEEDALRDSVILGTPDEVARAIDEYRRAAGGDLVFVARLYFPGLQLGRPAPGAAGIRRSRSGPAGQGTRRGRAPPWLSQGWVVGIDVGGTFTDAIATSADGDVRVAKVPSTPADPGLAFERALVALAEAGVRPESVLMIFHGTTVATNALLTGRTGQGRAGRDPGFRDILGYRNGSRPGGLRPGPAPAPASWCDAGTGSRWPSGCPASARCVTPLTPGGDRAGGRRGRGSAARGGRGLPAVQLPGRQPRASCSARPREEAARGAGHLVVRGGAAEFREYPRTSTAVINATLRPVVGSYLLQLRSGIGSLRIAPPLQIMQSNGGLPARRAGGEQAHRLVLSGPAAGVAGAVALGAQYGIGQLISLDMGGTSLDVCLVLTAFRRSPPGRRSTAARSSPRRWTSSRSARAAAASPRSTGPGGSGLARRAPAPSPGPAAYGDGGDRATLTDAHVVAGTLPASLPLAGSSRWTPPRHAPCLSPSPSGSACRCADAADGIVPARGRPDDRGAAPGLGAARDRPA